LIKIPLFGKILIDLERGDSNVLKKNVGQICQTAQSFAHPAALRRRKRRTIMVANLEASIWHYVNRCRWYLDVAILCGELYCQSCGK
jgi:hypothetical protein